MKSALLLLSLLLFNVEVSAVGGCEDDGSIPEFSTGDECQVNTIPIDDLHGVWLEDGWLESAGVQEFKVTIEQATISAPTRIYSLVSDYKGENEETQISINISPLYSWAPNEKTSLKLEVMVNDIERAMEVSFACLVDPKGFWISIGYVLSQSELPGAKDTLQLRVWDDLVSQCADEIYNVNLAAPPDAAEFSHIPGDDGGIMWEDGSIIFSYLHYANGFAPL